MTDPFARATNLEIARYRLARSREERIRGNRRGVATWLRMAGNLRRWLAAS